MIELTVTCPHCGEVCPLPPLYTETVMTWTGVERPPRLTLRLGDVASVEHECPLGTPIEVEHRRRNTQ